MDRGQGEGPGRLRGEEEQRDLSPSRGLNSAGLGPQDKIEGTLTFAKGPLVTRPGVGSATRGWECRGEGVKVEKGLENCVEALGVW